MHLLPMGKRGLDREEDGAGPQYLVLVSITKWVSKLCKSAGHIKLLCVSKSPINGGKKTNKDLTKLSKLLRQQLHFNTEL